MPPTHRMLGSLYTCPMHPEIRQGEPGPCPICGMALEPVAPTEDEESSVELIDMRRRFSISAALTIPVFVLAMGDLLPGEPISRWIAPGL